MVSKFHVVFFCVSVFFLILALFNLSFALFLLFWLFVVSLLVIPVIELNTGWVSAAINEWLEKRKND